MKKEDNFVETSVWHPLFKALHKYVRDLRKKGLSNKEIKKKLETLMEGFFE